MGLSLIQFSTVCCSITACSTATVSARDDRWDDYTFHDFVSSSRTIGLLNDAACPALRDFSQHVSKQGELMSE